MMTPPHLRGRQSASIGNCVTRSRSQSLVGNEDTEVAVSDASFRIDIENTEAHSWLRTELGPISMNLSTTAGGSCAPPPADALVAQARERKEAALIVAQAAVRVRQLEVAARVEIQRLQEEGATARCRIKEAESSKRADILAGVAKKATEENHQTRREQTALQEGNERLRIQEQAKAQRHDQRFSCMTRGLHLHVLATAWWVVGGLTRRGRPGFPLRPLHIIAACWIYWRFWLETNGPVLSVFAGPLTATMRQVLHYVKSRLRHSATKQMHTSKRLQVRDHDAQLLARPINGFGGDAPNCAKRRGNGPPDCDLEPDGWICNMRSNGRTFWHHTDLGPAPWEDTAVQAAAAAVGGTGGTVIWSGPAGDSSTAAGASSSHCLRESLAKCGLAEYGDVLEEFGYDQEVLSQLAPAEVEEMFQVVQCKPGHRSRFRRALQSWR